MTRKTVMLAAVACCCLGAKAAEGVASASSPDGRNQIRLYPEPLAYEVLRDGHVLIALSEIGMTVDGVAFTGKGGRRRSRPGKGPGAKKRPCTRREA